MMWWRAHISRWYSRRSSKRLGWLIGRWIRERIKVILRHSIFLRSPVFFLSFLAFHEKPAVHAELGSFLVFFPAVSTL